MPTERVARKRELRSEAVLDAAMGILETEGLDRLTLGRVAESLGMVPAALYRYFASKESLLAALRGRAVAQITDVLNRPLAALEPLSEPDRIIARLLQLARTYGTLPREVPQAWHLVSVMLAQPELVVPAEQAAVAAPTLAAALILACQDFERAAKLKVLSKGDATARTFAWWSALHGTAVLSKARFVTDQVPDVTVVSDLVARTLLEGWGCKPELIKRLSKRRAS